MLNILYQIFIAVGITIAIVVAYLWMQARKTSRINLELIKLNEQYQFDVPQFLQHVWPLLQKSGLQGFDWELNWYGVTVQEKHGVQEGTVEKREINIAEMKLILIFFQKRRGEKRYFDSTLIETLLLLLRANMWIKAGAVDATMSQMAKLNMFIQHDMKNVAQFIQLMSDQLIEVKPEQERQLLSYLRAAAPIMRQRADYIVKTLTIGQAQDEALTQVDIYKTCKDLCVLYQLDFRLNGRALMNLPENTFSNAIENILKNYDDICQRTGGLKPVVDIHIEENIEQVMLSITSNYQQKTVNLERLFEPFWSSHADGLGIGLYQAKHMLEKCGATISAGNKLSGELQFLVLIPKQK